MARSVLFTGTFWAATAERAVKTAAQAALALLTADTVISIVDVDVEQGAKVVALASVISLLTSVVSGLGGVGPSFTNSERLP